MNNRWRYLDAILDAGKGAAAARGRAGGGGGGDRPSLLLRERGHFSPARYFVEEVITGYDETDLHKTWLRANAMRSPQEKNTRLENMTWRIWNLARKKKEADGGVKHPILQDASCPVLQYADDTLILLKADIKSVTSLKSLLDSFSAATGLQINFSKSTVVPMHVDETVLPQCVAALGCRQEGFPQTYLGLPLSNGKLRLSAFNPFMCKADKYLAGWQGSLLNTQGRVALINSVIDAVPTYVMAAILWPPGAIYKYDSKRRAFLWSGEEKTSDAQCLVAWDKCCMQKTQGGLGVKNLALQNMCLLLKLVHRLYKPGQSSWAHWVRAHADIVSMKGDIDGGHWSDLRALLPAYRDITSVTVGDGKHTSFWEDAWLPAGRLSEVYPALFSHCTNTEATVHHILTHNLSSVLVPRLSWVAAQEFTEVTALLDTIEPNVQGDVRASPLLDAEDNLKSAPIYKMLTGAHRTPCDFFDFVWNNRAPPRVQFFGWLLVQERIQCKTNLLQKTIVDDAKCEVCNLAAETSDHLIFECPFSKTFWQAINFPIPGDAKVRGLWTVPRPTQVPEAQFAIYLLLCCWQLWKHRHDVVFRSMEPSLPLVLMTCREEASLWRCRLPRHEQSVADQWCLTFSPCKTFSLAVENCNMLG